MLEIAEKLKGEKNKECETTQRKSEFVSAADIQVYGVGRAVQRQHVAVRDHPEAAALSCAGRIYIWSDPCYVPGEIL